MTRAIQIKLLAAILGVLVVIASLLARGGDNRPLEITPADRQTEKRMNDTSAAAPRKYLVP